MSKTLHRPAQYGGHDWRVAFGSARQSCGAAVYECTSHQTNGPYQACGARIKLINLGSDGIHLYESEVQHHQERRPLSPTSKGISAEWRVLVDRMTLYPCIPPAQLHR